MYVLLVLLDLALDRDKSPTLRELCVLLLPALAAKWQHFCIAADLDEDGTTLEIVEQKHRDNPEACCRMVFMTWLKSEKKPTWGRVIECLKEAKCNQLAIKVEEYLLPSERESECFAIGLSLQSIIALLAYIIMYSENKPPDKFSVNTLNCIAQNTALPSPLHSFIPTLLTGEQLYVKPLTSITTPSPHICVNSATVT